MTFYPNLRDNVAGPLLKQFGQPMTYRVYGAEVYDNATGKTTKGTPTDTTINGLELSRRNIGSTAGQYFSEEELARASAVLLVDAKEYAIAGVEPEVNELVLYQSRTTKIMQIKTIGPASIPVAHFFAVQHV